LNNKRQHERVDVAMPVTLHYEGREISTHTRNVSVGGMLIEGSTEIPYGASVRVRATVPPNNSELDTVGTVRWVRDGAIGLQFASLRAKETWAINQLVKILSEPKSV
jgi:hypothetical protein